MSSERILHQRKVEEPWALSRREAGFWRGLVPSALALSETPCFLFAWEPLAAQVECLDQAFAGLPVRHWWSFKTLPLSSAVEAWRRSGRPVEVVSESELRAVLDLGFDGGSILVNGPAKHAWLGRYPVPALRVNFDSVREIRSLGPMARRCGWRVGVRLSQAAEDNFEFPGIRSPFGFLGGEEELAARALRRARLEVGVIHFHLRTNVPEPRYYREAIDDAMARARRVGWNPAVLDIGGGFPPGRVCSRKGSRLDAGFSLGAMRAVVEQALGRHELREVWMENGRWLVAPMAVLAVRVLEVKPDPARGARTLICDGGRTLQAMVATWERHALLPLKPRSGRRVASIVHGPTCMAFDNLGVHGLPSGVRVGDVLLWADAGAYQLSWETRFSHGWAGVVWTEAGRFACVRPTERVGAR